MPGIDQLKQFSEDITRIGNEAVVRQRKGTTMPEVAMPANIPSDDDSYDFEFGLPADKDAQNEASDSAVKNNQSGLDSSNENDESTTLPGQIPIPSFDDLDPEIAALLGAENEKTADIADISSNTSPDTASDMPEMDDFNDIFNTSEQMFDLSPDFESDMFSEEEDMPLSQDTDSAPDAEALAENEKTPAAANIQSQTTPLSADAGENEAASITSVQNDGKTPNVLQDMSMDMPDIDESDISADDILHIAQTDTDAVPENTAPVDALPDDIAPDDTANTAEADTDAASGQKETADFKAGNDTLQELDDFSDSTNGSEGFDLSSDFSDESAEKNTAASLSADIAEAEKDFDLDTDLAAFTAGTEESSEQTAKENGGDNAQGGSAADIGESIANAPFDMPPPEIPNNADEALQDFNLDSFEIPGFSDTTASSADKAFAAFKKKSAGESDSDRTHLTDNEYKLFIKNLKAYPLNLRIALEELIVKNEFTDPAVMELLFKVVKKVPARQLAGYLEKMFDISVSVPLNYERRTAEQYEIYKTSLEYNLKNRIIPGAIAAVVLGGFLYILSYLSYTFIYRPVKAEVLYKTGYNLIDQDLYVQSEEKFNEALTYKVKKRWFFKYARAYRAKRQYERSSIMYEQLIKRFNFDKAGGLEYARMVMEDLADYEKAVRITRRMVLDYHINDKDALLLLGDIYLEWASNTDDEAEKAALFEQGRLQYATLINFHNVKDLYLARMLRYFIRTDNLREVLTLKTHFISKKKTTLESADLIELGEYLFEKQYGYLPPADEYLRSYIDNVKNILEMGIKSDPSVPEGYYNLARYLIRTGNADQAKQTLANALAVFAAAKKQTHARTLKYINTHRLLGEQYVNTRDYLLAEKYYADGIALFEREREYTGLTGNKNIGMLYSDIGDIDYFISGDIENAERNYKRAVENQYDTPSIRYRIGFVQYSNKNYSEALGSFIKTASEDASNRNLLLALGNVLSIRGDDAAARGYYERLVHILDADKQRFEIVLPQMREDHRTLVELYLKASNNLGVTLSRLALQTGNSALQAQAVSHFAESVRAWDALTRNQKTMVRLEGSNLAAQNIKYVSYSDPVYEPAIYAAIPSVLYGETELKQFAFE